MAFMIRSKIFNYLFRLPKSTFVEQCVNRRQLKYETSYRGFSITSKPIQNLDYSLRQLDDEVRRVGRISRRDIESILREIRNQKSATSSQSLLLLRCCGNLVSEELPEARTALVHEIWNTIDKLNIAVDISHYNALLRVYLENEHKFSPTDFLSNLKAKNIEPNRITYQRLIAAFCQQGDIQGATKILEFMKENQLPINEYIFNSLIIGYSQANDMKSAAGILDTMKQAGIEPTNDTYTTLLCCYGRHGDLNSILEIFNKCERKNIHILDKDILEVIFALTINGHESKIDDLLGKIRKSIGYNKDAINMILRLINKGYEDVAYKIFRTMTLLVKTRDESNSGIFFIRQLVKAKRPVFKIIEICRKLQEEGLNSKALLIATEASITGGETTMAYSLMKELKINGWPIRYHYFWPLICSASPDQILDILKIMNDEFELIPNKETIRDYVIPNLKEPDFKKVISLLKTLGIPTGDIISSLVYKALNSNELQTAMEIASSENVIYSLDVLTKPLIGALAKTKDFDSYFKLLRIFFENFSSLIDSEERFDNTEKINNRKIINNQLEDFGHIILATLKYFKHNRVEMLEKILRYMVEQGLSISKEHVDLIKNSNESELNSEILDLLEKITFDDTKLFEKRNKRYERKLENISSEELENLIDITEIDGENATKINRYLNSCLRSKNIEKAEQIFKILESKNYLKSGMYAQLIDLYCHHNKLDEALQAFERIKNKEPDFVLDNLKTMKIVQLMIKDKKIDEAIKFLDLNKKDEKVQYSTRIYFALCWRILNSLAEAGNAQDLKKIFEALETKNYIVLNNILLGPLVKVHLVNNDIISAIDTFEEMCNKHQATPCKNELACYLIKAEDATNLQKLTDLSTNVHGEINSLYDLIFSFIECNRIDQARKILETPGLRSGTQRINSICDHYRKKKNAQFLEGLIEATKGLKYVDYNYIYYNLLSVYCANDQSEKALDLLRKMQENNITPSDQFLLKLADYLKQRKMEVSFEVPTVQQDSSVKREVSF